MPVGRKLPAVDITEGGKYFHVRMRQPKGSTCRVPDWASRAANTISKGSKVVMCKLKDRWYLQSVMIMKGNGKTARDARRLAIKIRNKIES